MISILIFFLNRVYGIIKMFVPSRDKVTLVSRQSNKPSINFLLLQQEFARREDPPCVVMLCKTLDKDLWGMTSYLFHLLKQMYHFASSRVVILDTYSILASAAKHKPDLVIIQMWHSIGTMKKFGYMTLGAREGRTEKVARVMRMHANYDYFFASSPAYSDYLAEGFGDSPDKVVIKPLPYVDLLTSKEYATKTRARIYQALGDISAKKTILYCPTFRKDTTGLKAAITELIGSVDYQKYNLVIKQHPISKIPIDDPRVLSAKGFSTFDMLFVADIVISDYSCVVFEAGLLDLPVYFYCFDYEAYQKARGLTYDYLHESPGVVSPDIHTILSAIENDPYDLDYLRSFVRKYVVETTHATKDIVDFVMSFLVKSILDKV